MNEAESYALGMELERDSVIAECKQMQKDLDAQSKLADTLAGALEKAADTLRDAAAAYRFFGKHVAAEAMEIAEKYSREVLRAARGLQ